MVNSTKDFMRKILWKIVSNRNIFACFADERRHAEKSGEFCCPQAWRRDRPARSQSATDYPGGQRVLGYRTIQVVYGPFDPQEELFSAALLTVICNKGRLVAPIAINLQVGCQTGSKKNAGVGSEAQGSK